MHELSELILLQHSNFDRTDEEIADSLLSEMPEIQQEEVGKAKKLIVHRSSSI